MIKDQSVCRCRRARASWCQPLLTCYRAAKSVRDQLVPADGAERSGCHIGTRMPQPLLKGLLPAEAATTRGAHLGWLRPGLRPAAWPCAHRTAGARKSHVTHDPVSSDALASEWCAGRHVPAYPTRRPLRGSLNRQDASRIPPAAGYDYLRDLTAGPNAG